MRVLRISHASLTPALRERERALVRRHRNVDLEVVTTERWREAEVDVEAVDDDLFPVTRARVRLSKHVQLFAYDPRPIVASLSRHKPDVIELNAEPYSVACAEVLALCRWFAPQAAVVMQACQNIFRRYPPPFHWLERRALRYIDAASVCSETTREVLRAKGFRKPAEIIPFGVDTSAFRPRRSRGADSSATLTIGFVGRILPGKGLNVLAEALGMLGSEPWKLLVIGDGPERRSFEQSLATRGLLNRAEFLGAISYDKVADFYQRMDMLVTPTQTTKRIREQFGRVLVEAMASAVPVIGSTCGAIPEVIGDAGLVVPEGDAAALADALRKLLSDSALCERLARAGRDRAEQCFSWERVADKTHELFLQILRSKSAAFNERPELFALEPKVIQ
ncbi:MAG TPA: glycosyltransferase [Pyrinomonadaceae bacterium]|nr:glycosyltransferase [Pyrinomonadaceae bacterium]